MHLQLPLVEDEEYGDELLGVESCGGGLGGGGLRVGVLDGALVEALVALM